MGKLVSCVDKWLWNGNIYIEIFMFWFFFFIVLSIIVLLIFEEDVLIIMLGLV